MRLIFALFWIIPFMIHVAAASEQNDAIDKPAFEGTNLTKSKMVSSISFHIPGADNAAPSFDLATKENHLLANLPEDIQKVLVLKISKYDRQMMALVNRSWSKAVNQTRQGQWIYMFDPSKFSAWPFDRKDLHPWIGIGTNHWCGHFSPGIKAGFYALKNLLHPRQDAIKSLKLSYTQPGEGHLNPYYDESQINWKIKGLESFELAIDGSRCTSIQDDFKNIDDAITHLVKENENLQLILITCHDHQPEDSGIDFSLTLYHRLKLNVLDKLNNKTKIALLSKVVFDSLPSDEMQKSYLTQFKTTKQIDHGSIVYFDKNHPIDLTVNPCKFWLKVEKTMDEAA